MSRLTPQPVQRLLALALVVTSLAACRSEPKGFDQLNLITEEVGETRVDSVVKVPANVGDITSWRTTFPGQVFAAVKAEAPCPRDIHTLAGVLFKKERIELCFSAPPRDEPVPGFACSKEVYLKYEIMGMPADREPKFAYIGACPGIPQ